MTLSVRNSIYYWIAFGQLLHDRNHINASSHQIKDIFIIKYNLELEQSVEVWNIVGLNLHFYGKKKNNLLNVIFVKFYHLQMQDIKRGYLVKYKYNAGRALRRKIDESARMRPRRMNEKSTCIVRASFTRLHCSTRTSSRRTYDCTARSHRPVLSHETRCRHVIITWSANYGSPSVNTRNNCGARPRGIYCHAIPSPRNSINRQKKELKSATIRGIIGALLTRPPFCFELSGFAAIREFFHYFKTRRWNSLF